MQQVALRFEKREEVRFLYHLDVVRTLERALRRAGLSLPELEVEKQGRRGARRLNLRPLILGLEARLDRQEAPGLWMRLPCQGVSIRPEQVAEAMGLAGPFRVHRVALYGSGNRESCSGNRDAGNENP